MSRVLQKKKNLITQGYNKKNHEAVDLVGNDRSLDNIVAHSDGEIVFSQRDFKNNKGSIGNASYGNCLKIKHKNSYYTLYAHMEKGSVKLRIGQKVKKGQVIGYMGNSGNAYGNHLHFEVWKGNKRINPVPYLDKDLPGNKTEEKKNYYKKYTGKSSSFVDALKSQKIDSSFSNRRKIALKNGIKIYLGTASQNTKLLTLLKQGKLIK